MFFQFILTRRRRKSPQFLKIICRISFSERHSCSESCSCNHLVKNRYMTRLARIRFIRVYMELTMAKAKGITPSRIAMLHILKNAMIPVITASGPMIAFLLTGSFVVETIFTIPGIGREFVTAVSNRDYTVVMGLTIFIGALIIVCNLAADLLCAFIDPRIKLSE